MCTFIMYPNREHENQSTELPVSTREESVEPESGDSKGIPGWDRVDKLAKALIRLSLKSAHASEIHKLYSNLIEFDKFSILAPEGTAELTWTE